MPPTNVTFREQLENVLLRALGGAVAEDVQEVIDGLVAAAEGGGSQTFRRVRLPVTFETPNFAVTGIVITRLALDEIMLAAGTDAGVAGYLFVAPMFCITSQWVATSPDANFYIGAYLGGSPPGTLNPPAASNANSISTFILSILNNNSGNPGMLGAAGDPLYAHGDGPGSNLYNVTDNYPIIVWADDTAGGDPGFTSGEGFFDLLILTAP